MAICALIWDLDGTLADSYPAIVPAVREALAAFGLRLGEEEIRREVLLSSVGALIRRVSAENGLDRAALQAAFDRCNAEGASRVRAMPHAAEALAALSRAGHRNFVYTHRGASCAAILAPPGLAPYITETVTAPNGFPRKPAPAGILYLMRKYALDPARCYYVGDRRLDVEAAEAAGVGSILFLDPASPCRPTGRETALVRDLLEIPALLAR